MCLKGMVQSGSCTHGLCLLDAVWTKAVNLNTPPRQNEGCSLIFWEKMPHILRRVGFVILGSKKQNLTWERLRMFKHKAASDDFTQSELTSGWIVLEKRSMCLAHPVAFNSDWDILSGCFAVVCVCVWGCMPHVASRNRKQGKLWAEMSQLGHAVFRPEFPRYLFVVKEASEYVQSN